jgi:hypothetical protein
MVSERSPERREPVDLIGADSSNSEVDVAMFASCVVPGVSDEARSMTAPLALMVSTPSPDEGEATLCSSA